MSKGYKRLKDPKLYAWYVTATEENNAVSVRVTCNFCQWGGSFRSTNTQKHLETCSASRSHCRGRHSRNIRQKRIKVFEGRAWSIYKSEKNDDNLRIRYVCNSCAKEMSSATYYRHRKTCNPKLDAPSKGTPETGDARQPDQTSKIVPPSRPMLKPPLNLTPQPSASAEGRELSKLQSIVGTSSHIQDVSKALLEEAEQARLKRFKWMKDIRDRFVNTWHEFDGWYQEWRLRCQGEIAALRGEGFADAARQLEQCLGDSTVYSDPGLFKIVWPTGYGEEVFYFRGISDPAKQRDTVVMASDDDSSDLSSTKSDSDYGEELNDDRNSRSREPTNVGERARENTVASSSRIKNKSNTSCVPCDRCRTSHSKCSLGKPSCSQCLRIGENCVYGNARPPAREQYRRWSTRRLETECRTRGLGVEESKAKMVDRLIHDDQAQKMGSTRSFPAAENRPTVKPQ